MVRGARVEPALAFSLPAVRSELGRVGRVERAGVESKTCCLLPLCSRRRSGRLGFHEIFAKCQPEAGALHIGAFRPEAVGRGRTRARNFPVRSPGPVSAMRMRRCAAGIARQETVTRPPGRLYLTVLESRLSKIWLRRWRLTGTARPAAGLSSHPTTTRCGVVSGRMISTLVGMTSRGGRPPVSACRGPFPTVRCRAHRRSWPEAAGRWSGRA